MRISPIANQYKSSINTQNKNSRTSFPTFESKLSKIEKAFNNKGIVTGFGDNVFAAEFILKIAEVFEKLYGISSLPKAVIMRPMAEKDYGKFNYIYDIVEFNSAISRFKNMQALNDYAENGKGFIIDEFSTSHPAMVFVHEFAHCAHKDNIKKQGRDAIDVMFKLSKMQVPTAVGKLITKFKLGKYATTDKGGLNEFMAERATQDICNALTEKEWDYWRDPKTVDYSDIFRRKWNCRYTSPQSYLDYYTQQIWNGDIKEAEQAAKIISVYLEEIDRQSQPTEIKQHSFWGVVDYINAKINLQAKWLDDKNRLGYKDKK